MSEISESCASTRRQYFEREVLPQIRMFDVQCQFKNTYDVHHLTSKCICSMCRTAYLRIAFMNVLTMNDMLRNDPERYGETFIIIDNWGRKPLSSFVVDYRYDGSHYHVYVPSTYFMDPTTDRIEWQKPVRETHCPVCLDVLRSSVVACRQCGNVTCYECCIDHTDYYGTVTWTTCCMCRYSPRIDSSTVIFQNFPACVHPLTLYFSVSPDPAASSTEYVLKTVLDTKDNEALTKFLCARNKIGFDNLLVRIYERSVSSHTYVHENNVCIPGKNNVVVEFDVTDLENYDDSLSATTSNDYYHYYSEEDF